MPPEGRFVNADGAQAGERHMHEVVAGGASIPALGLGTYELTGSACSDLVAHALNIGYRHIDTAAMYGNETDVGRGLKASSVAREDVFLTTKVWRSDIAPGDLQRSAEQSLRRLGVDQVDLLLIHWPNFSVPLAGSIEALNDARRKGYARHIGVSNFPTWLLDEAVGLSEAPLVAEQAEYHPYLDQSKLLAACRRQGMAFVSYCPLYRGALLDEPAVTAAARRTGKTPGQVVLRWHMQQPGVVAIPRTSRRERLAENLDIFDFELSQAEMDAISALTRRGERLVDQEFPPGRGWD